MQSYLSRLGNNQDGVAHDLRGHGRHADDSKVHFEDGMKNESVVPYVQKGTSLDEKSDTARRPGRKNQDDLDGKPWEKQMPGMAST